MLDFVSIDVCESKKLGLYIWPDFSYGTFTEDLMIQGGSPKCIWDEDNNIWTTSKQRMAQLIDNTVETLADNRGLQGFIKKAANSRTGVMDDFARFCRNYSDYGKPTDTVLTFRSQKTRKEDYCTRRLDYDIEDIPTPCFDELMSKLYDPEEAHKIVWGIGSVLSGDSKKIQKMFVLHGMPGTGKTTILEIIRLLFKDYCTTFSAEQLGYSGNQFAMAPFRMNPLIAIDDDGDLSKIETNVQLNMVASHASTIINEKNKAQYSICPIAQMWIATNLPVKISGINSGLVRRIIDVKTRDIRNPIASDRYNMLMIGINNELPGIASKCLQEYTRMGKDFYKHYEPLEFMRRTDYIFNFVSEMSDKWENEPEVTLSQAWELWKTYCHEIGLDSKMNRNSLATNLKNYFDEFHERSGGKYSVFKGFHLCAKQGDDKDESTDWLDLREPGEEGSIFDNSHKDCVACYSKDSIPETSWDECRSKLSELDTSKEHFVGGESTGWDIHEIVIDFDAKNEKGEKDLGRNKLLAANWPRTYAETSKSGSGLHLHYYYTGSDVKSLERRISPDVEVKVFVGKSSLRRRLIRCNREPIATLRPGLLKIKEEKMINFNEFKDAEHLRNFVKKCLAKAHHGSTKPEIDYMYDGLEKAYKMGMPYDLEDMKEAVWRFASGSSHNASYCQEKVLQMKFKSETEPTAEQSEKPWAIYDVEVFPNWNCLNWVQFDKDKFLAGAPYEECMVGEVHELWCPDVKTVEAFVNGFNTIGFNNRRYDNHIIYALLMGYSAQETYKVSQRLIFDDAWSGFIEAYNLSYFDIYDMSNTKQSLKKWEIELGIAHIENEYAWDQDLPEEHWQEVSSYCVNDVKATCAVLCHLIDDFRAREILSAISGLPLNATTNKHTTQIITGGDKDANKSFVYNDFPGYTYDHGKSTYRGEDVGEGGYVYSEPGYYTDVALLDIASMHPHSLIALNMFGPYTDRFQQIVQARILVKHKDYEGACNILGGALKPFIQPDMANSKDLAFALKIAINSVYGLTAAKFENALRDPRNKDNIVAKRGALFMVDLKHFVQERGFTVAHIKTDSIKIPNATPEIIKEVYDYGQKWGYTFEHEATYKKLLLIDKAQYIAQDASDNHWTATGKEFQQPPVFKGLFTKEPISIEDQAITFEVQTHLRLGDKYVGKVGSLVPAVDGKELTRWNDKTQKYGAATGAKDYLWELTEYAKIPQMNVTIDDRYWDEKRKEAVELIEQYVQVDKFMED